MSIFLVLLAAYGLCFGLMNDKAKFLTDLLVKIPLFPDEEGNTFFARMFVCPYCTGFHTGWMAWLFFLAPTYFFDGLLGPESITEALMFGFASSVFCYGVDIVIQWFER